MEKNDFVYAKYIEESLHFSAVYKYLDKYTGDDVFLYADKNACTKIKKNQTVWTLWLQGENAAPRIIRKCIDSVRENKPDDYEMVVLDEDNLSDYISLPDYVIDKFHEGKITKTHFSDLIRLELLLKYGGLWVDASVFCCKKMPKVITSGELFFFKSSSMDHPMYKGSSWWIYAKAGNRLICGARNILYKYWINEDDLKDYYLVHIAISKLIDCDVECSRLYRDMPTIGNMQPHVLWGKMDQVFSEKDWEWIKDNAYVHKLSYKRHLVMGDQYNYYNALLDDKL